LSARLDSAAAWLPGMPGPTHVNGPFFALCCGALIKGHTASGGNQAATLLLQSIILSGICRPDGCEGFSLLLQPCVRPRIRRKRVGPHGLLAVSGSVTSLPAPNARAIRLALRLSPASA